MFFQLLKTSSKSYVIALVNKKSILSVAPAFGFPPLRTLVKAIELLQPVHHMGSVVASSSTVYRFEAVEAGAM